jgi:cytochrome b6-f complex iron-sulfur subunit
MGRKINRMIKGWSMSEKSSQTAPAMANEGALPIQVTRRTLLKGVIGILGAFGLGGLFYGVYRFLSPEAGGGAPMEISLSEIPSGGTQYFQYDGSPGILFRGEDGSFKAFSLICTHLACTVTWRPERNGFYCPCHDGFFDAEGKVLSGPPPAPLERWKVEVKGDKVVIGVA